MNTMGEQMPHTDQEFHRKVAVECFNKTWDFLKKKDRTPNDEQLMLNLAHSSRYHWSFVGKAGNFAIGDWQISRVYSALSQRDLAMHFAKTSLETCLKNDLSDILVSAYEGMARAYAIAKEYRLASECINKARQQLRNVVLDHEDSKIYSDQIEETERMIKQ
jgi:hypothetical protein